MEQLLHSGSGGGDAGGGTVAYDAGGSCRILPGIECRSSGIRGGDALTMGAGSGDTLARMGSEETIWAAAGVLRAWVKKYGVPVALYIQFEAEFSEDVIAQDSVHLSSKCAGGSLRVNYSQKRAFEYMFADS
jgi:hypothetical protein